MPKQKVQTQEKIEKSTGCTAIEYDYLVIKYIKKKSNTSIHNLLCSLPVRDYADTSFIMSVLFTSIIYLFRCFHIRKLACFITLH